MLSKSLPSMYSSFEKLTLRVVIASALGLFSTSANSVLLPKLVSTTLTGLKTAITLSAFLLRKSLTQASRYPLSTSLLDLATPIRSQKSLIASGG